MTQDAKKMMARAFRAMRRELGREIDSLDMVEAAYHWFYDHHRGQFSPEYECGCVLGQVFSPAMNGLEPYSSAHSAYRILCEEFGGECSCRDDNES